MYSSARLGLLALLALLASGAFGDDWEYYRRPVGGGTPEFSTAPLEVEADPVFAAAPAAGISAQDLLDYAAAFGWGDHALAGYVLGSDARLSDARAPTAHASSHATGGADAITPGDIGAATAAQGALADSAVQPADLAAGTITAAAGAIDLTGTDGQVLTLDASGNIAPETPSGGSSLPSCGWANIRGSGATVSMPTTTFTDITSTFDVELADADGLWSSSVGYTAPADGVYGIWVATAGPSVPDGTLLVVDAGVNGVRVKRPAIAQTAALASARNAGSTVLDLSAGDVVTIWQYWFLSGSGASYAWGNSDSALHSLSIHRLGACQ